MNFLALIEVGEEMFLEEDVDEPTVCLGLGNVSKGKQNITSVCFWQSCVPTTDTHRGRSHGDAGVALGAAVALLTSDSHLQLLGLRENKFLLWCLLYSPSQLIYCLSRFFGTVNLV